MTTSPAAEPPTSDASTEEEDIVFEQLSAPPSVAGAPALPAQPKEREEPIPMAEAMKLGNIDSLSAFIADREADWKANPEGYFRIGFCRHCNKPLGDKPEDKAIKIAENTFLPIVCCAGCADLGKQRLAEEDRKARDARFAGLIPTEFVAWDENFGNNVALAKARGAFSITAKKGVLIHGTSGSCKTRIMWQLVKHLAGQPEGFSWLVLDAFEISTNGIPKEAHTVQFLFIDDIGNESDDFRNKKKFETSFLHLMRKRFDWHRTTVITTQLTGAAFKQKFLSGTAGEAIMRRLKERMDTVCTDGATEIPKARAA